MSTASLSSENKKPRVSIPRLEKLCGLLGSWRKQTKGRRVECVRHHLKNDVLAGFRHAELVVAIACAVMGKGDGGDVFENVCAKVEQDLTGRDVLNVIYEFDGIEDFILQGLARVTVAPADLSENPKANMGYAIQLATKHTTRVLIAA